MKMDSIAVRMEDVSKFYKLYDSPKARFKEALDPFRRSRHQDFYALHSINLEVRKGEILGVVGRNGSGKSTLLKLLAGVIPPSSGRLTVSGSVSAMLELGSGLNPDLNGIDNIYFGGILLGFSREEMKSRMDEIVAFADIGEFIHQPLKTYSSGMRARLGFALAVSIQPDILVVDEVLAVGDDLFKRKCFAKMEELFQTGCTVFFVSHSLPNIIEICTRAILLDQGELILDGSPKLVTMNYLKYIYTPRNEQNEVRKDILRLNQDKKKKEEHAADPAAVSAAPSDEKKDVMLSDKRNQKSGQTAFYMPDFISKSTAISKICDINIHDFQLKTMDGRRINALVMNEEYIYSYNVTFGIEIQDVSFGMGFKSEKGLALCWMIYPGIDKFIEQKFCKGDTYNVSWRFKCLFTPGTFYVDSGVRTRENGEMVFLVKVQDAVAFKVLSDDTRQKGGIFDSITGVEIKKY